MNKPRYLYHYTDFDGLKGIIDSRKLRFSDYRCMSDTSEFAYSKEFLCLSIQEAYQCLYGKTDQEKLEELCERIWKIFIYKKHPDAYLFCLCRPKKGYERNGLLSMWRSYGQQGGYALVFNKKNFCNEAKSFRCLSLHGKVRYPHTHEELIKNFKTNMPTFNSFVEKQIIPKYLDRTHAFDPTIKDLSSILHLLTLTKHPGFHEENEYRFCVYDLKNQDSFNPEIQKSDLSIKSYVEFAVKLENFVEEIIIGPQQDIETKEEFLKGYLRSQGLTITVRTSDIPYIPR